VRAFALSATGCSISARRQPGPSTSETEVKARDSPSQDQEAGATVPAATSPRSPGVHRHSLAEAAIASAPISRHRMKITLT
jgi:hypothetical protein